MTSAKGTLVDIEGDVTVEVAEAKSGFEWDVEIGIGAEKDNFEERCLLFLTKMEDM